ncbi:MAG: HlyC/CorC family transporter [Pseudolabrys sp.]|nr:HlyC/CorC family transporter [Pseudolabrys sp.]MSP33218.1 HlyC/CorC family transporter [Pseudolabrys sp.]
MPDSDNPTSSSAGGAPFDARNLPVPVPPVRETGESWLVRAFRTLFGWKPGSIRADLKDVLDAMTPGESGFSPEESRMLKNILGLRERRVGDVMVPRADIIAVQQDIHIGELVRVFEGAAHSRLVVYNDTLDDPVGMVHIRDLIAFMTAHAAVNPEKNAKRKKPLPAGLDLKAINLAMPLSGAKIVREILFVPPSARLIDLLARMQAKQIHLALVVDEYGGSDGIVSIEDIVEQIVGDIADEHDEDVAADVVRQPDGSYIADARAKLEDVVAIVGHEFDVGDATEEVDTLGGYLVTRAGRLPLRGEIVPGPELFEFEVLDADPRRVKRIRITRLKERRERTREPRKRGEPDAVLAGTTPPSLPADDTPAQKSPADSPATPRRP